MRADVCAAREICLREGTASETDRVISPVEAGRPSFASGAATTSSAGWFWPDRIIRLSLRSPSVLYRA